MKMKINWKEMKPWVASFIVCEIIGNIIYGLMIFATPVGHPPFWVMTVVVFVIFIIARIIASIMKWGFSDF